MADGLQYNPLAPSLGIDQRKPAPVSETVPSVEVSLRVALNFVRKIADVGRCRNMPHVSLCAYTAMPFSPSNVRSLCIHKDSNVVKLVQTATIQTSQINYNSPRCPEAPQIFVSSSSATSSLLIQVPAKIMQQTAATHSDRADLIVKGALQQLRCHTALGRIAEAAPL
jgi:hypothetical protein